MLFSWGGEALKVEGEQKAMWEDESWGRVRKQSCGAQRA